MTDEGNSAGNGESGEKYPGEFVVAEVHLVSCSTNQSSRSPIVPARRAAYVAGMDSSALTREQFEAMQEPITRQLRYLGRLRDRMNRLGFPPSDPLIEHVTAAFNAVHALRVHVHYNVCSPGTVG
jgi:hypothetical protein